MIASVHWEFSLSTQLSSCLPKSLLYPKVLSEAERRMRTLPVPKLPVSDRAAQPLHTQATFPSSSRVISLIHFPSEPSQHRSMTCFQVYCIHLLQFYACPIFPVSPCVKYPPWPCPFNHLWLKTLKVRDLFTNTTFPAMPWASSFQKKLTANFTRQNHLTLLVATWKHFIWHRVWRYIAAISSEKPEAKNYGPVCLESELQKSMLFRSQLTRNHPKAGSHWTVSKSSTARKTCHLENELIHIYYNPDVSMRSKMCPF